MAAAEHLHRQSMSSGCRHRAQGGRAVAGAASGAVSEGERKYTAEDYALAAKRGEIYDSEEGFFGA